MPLGCHSFFKDVAAGCVWATWICQEHWNYLHWSMAKTWNWSHHPTNLELFFSGLMEGILLNAGWTVEVVCFKVQIDIWCFWMFEDRDRYMHLCPQKGKLCIHEFKRHVPRSGVFRVLGSYHGLRQGVRNSFNLSGLVLEIGLRLDVYAPGLSKLLNWRSEVWSSIHS